MDDGALASYLADLKRHPLLTREEETRYARAARDGDEDAKETLVNSNLRFVVNIARQYQHRGIPLADLVSEGNIGLLKAAEKFDPERGYHFTTYAVWWIRQAILKALEASSRTIRLPAHAAGIVERIGWARTELSERLSREPTVHEIAAFLGQPPQRVAELLTVSRELLSFEAPAFEDGTAAQLGDSVRDGARSPEEEAMAGVLKADINHVLDSLSRRGGGHPAESIRPQRPPASYPDRARTALPADQGTGAADRKTRVATAPGILAAARAGGLSRLTRGLLSGGAAGR